MVGLLVGLFEWLEVEQIDETNIPKQGIQQSPKNALRIMGIMGLVFGGEAIIRHYILRWLLARNNYLPSPYWHLVLFLDYASGLIFFRQVGGGYIFVHRLLMEHFAALETDP